LVKLNLESKLTLEESMKIIFLVSGLLSGGLGFVIFFSSRASQQTEGLMLFLIGTVGAQGETNALLRELLEASRQRRRNVQENPTGSKAKTEAAAPAAPAPPAAEAQDESQTETQVA
jgi:hypothetical protein